MTIYNLYGDEADEEIKIKDSGERREFETGAVRDIQEGVKGRCDLLPLDVVGECYRAKFGEDDSAYKIMYAISEFKKTGICDYLILALDEFLIESEFESWSDMFLEVAMHFEEGAKKYGEYNWQKGIPVHSYIDSAVRHYLRWLRGDKDERHDRSFVWNILCCIWTIKHKPELNDFVEN